MLPLWASLVALLAGIIGLVIAWLPRTDHLELSSFPNPLWLYVQAAVTMLTKRGALPRQKDGPLKGLQVTMSRPVRFNTRRFQSFLQLAGFESGLHGGTPLSYPIVEAFRLCIQVMLLPSFPFNVLGSVLARNQVIMYRPIAADEQLVYRCEVEPAVRRSAKGDYEIDLLTAASSTRDGSLVWVNTLTVIILSPTRRKPAAPASAATAAQASAEKKIEGSAAGTTGGGQLSQALKVIDTWVLGSDTGRRYGWLNGDLNPIHLHPLTSRLFGYKRPIAHALCLVAKAEASLLNHGVVPSYPAVLQTDFKRPTLLPATLTFAWRPVPMSGIAAALGSEDGLSFAVLTEDGAKEVLVGKLLQRQNSTSEPS